MSFSQTQAHIPDSLQLQSSSTLGTGRVSTHRERLDKLEDKDVRKALAGRSGKRKRNDNYEVSLAEEDSDGSESDVAMRRSSSRSKSPIASKDTHPVESTASAVVGSALQRNPDGTAVAPRIRVKSDKKKASLPDGLSSPSNLVIRLRSVVGAPPNQ